VPLPSPKTGESRESFLARCMGDEQLLAEYPDQSQRAAILGKTWDEAQTANHSAPESEVEITRVGVYRDSRGREMRFDDADLDRLAAAGPAPASELKFGHEPATSGWVKRLLGVESCGSFPSLVRRGASLFARLADVPAAVKGLITGAGRVPVSPEYTLDAAGRPARFSGLALVPNPAMKNLDGLTAANLRAAAFAAASDRITVALRAADGELALFEEQPEEDFPMKPEELKALFEAQTKAISDGVAAALAAQKPGTPAPAVFSADQTKALGEQVAAAVGTALAPLAAKVEAAQARVAAFEGETRAREIATFARRMVEARKLKPAEVERLTARLADAGDRKVKLGGQEVALFADIQHEIESRPAQWGPRKSAPGIALGAPGAGGAGGTAQFSEIGEAARSLQAQAVAQGKKLTLREATARAAELHPELAQERAQGARPLAAG